MNRIILITLALAASATAASAHDYYREGRIDDRRAIQEYKLQRARNSGELTNFENGKLEYEQYRIRQMEQRALRDGYINKWEARRIANAQDRAARDIYQQSHDGDRKWWAGW
jgi:hypothetical protein